MTEGSLMDPVAMEESLKPCENYREEEEEGITQTKALEIAASLHPMVLAEMARVPDDDAEPGGR